MIAHNSTKMACTRRSSGCLLCPFHRVRASCHEVAKIVHCGLSRAHIALLGRPCVSSVRLGVTAKLGHFSQLLEEIEHFCGCRQEKVAKIVQCGEKFLLIKIKKAICNGGLKFYCEAAALRRHIRAKAMNSPRCLQLRKEGVDLHSARRLFFM